MCRKWFLREILSSRINSVLLLGVSLPHEKLHLYISDATYQNDNSYNEKLLHIQGWAEKLFDNVVSAVDDFLTNGIHAL